MSEVKKFKLDKNILIIAAITVAIAIGAWVYESQKKETVSIKLGDQEISATFEQ